MDHLLDRVGEGILTVDSEWRVTETNSTASRLLGQEESALVGTDIREEFPRSVESTFHDTYGGEEPSRDGTAFEEFFPELETWLEVRVCPSNGGFSVHLSDITEHQRLRRELEAQQDELTTLTRINSIIQEVLLSLAGATTREEIEQILCEQLAATGLYEFAWVGDREATADRIAVRTTAGDHDDVVERISEESAGSNGGIEDAAISTGELQTVRELATDVGVPEAVRREAFARGLQSSLAVPLVYGSTVYGVLGVYASRPDAFSARERTSFETLGKLSGFAINAARQRNLLLSDTVIELTFQVTDTDAFFVTASKELDCTITIEGIVPLSERALLYYVGLDGATADDFLEVVAESSAVDVDRVVRDHGTDCLIEARISDASPVLTLSGQGATIRTAVFEEADGEIVAEVSSGENVKAIVESARTEFPDTELLSKLEQYRSVETAQEFRSELHDLLTDRQRTALRTAYLADYFESPRGSTAEEIAETLDITSPTLHSHLRTAQRKLLDVFFDEGEIMRDGRRET